jgi:hypothetical protein
MTSESFLNNQKPCFQNGDLASTIFWHVKPLRKSITECLTSHDYCPKPSKSFMPTRLLRLQTKENDSLMMTLVDPSKDKVQPYAALSYCWGGNQELTLTQTTQAQLKDGVDANVLPPTLRDACLVAVELEIFHLWIDSLCIF